MKTICTVIGGMAVLAATSFASAADVDFSDPEAVTAAIFTAARTGDDTALARLCDPEGKNDGDTRRYICEVTVDGARWIEYVSYFAKGKVSAPARITGDTAKVPFLFGPDGKKKETMNLIRRGKKWFLLSF